MPRVKRDQHGLYQAACAELADDLGYRRKEVFSTWEQCALIREYEMRVPRAVAEAFALRDVKAIFDKRGQVAD